MARDSLEELRLDYEDFLRQRRLAIWAREDLRRVDLIARRCRTGDDIARWVKMVHHGRSGLCGRNGQGSASIQSSTYPEIVANAALVLIAVACSLLDRQIAAQSKAFEKEGGFSERMYRVRTSRRKS